MTPSFTKYFVCSDKFRSFTNAMLRSRMISHGATATIAVNIGIYCSNQSCPVLVTCNFTEYPENLRNIQDIWSGKGKSFRHDQYARGGADRQELRFSMITDPYTELQLDWVLDEISKVRFSHAL